MTRTPRASAGDELRPIAAARFARDGFQATSLQQIADEAGYSKSSVLYHFASKEALLEALLEPTIDALAEVIDRADSIRGDADARRAFVERFIDFLLLHRHEVSLFITQGRSLGHLAVIQRANDLVRRLGETAGALDSALDQLRYGVALGGAAYVLAASDDWSTNEPLPDDEVRAALVVVVGELLAPLASRSA
ncbi:TetR/AcrR family transcriptional regulator [Clavibacter michiganensis]|uniref:TetR/AcrR family transcriptional regulator n=1 Tax=Clavibacter michiganensis TaxID=28447 RepID=A0A2S5VRB8_9MICO|nr:TetR/AcrR family transcriptional regulator [Clavibacter michiganensis]PPF56906.1 TetR/AcrR family transcriptional regulator [Clavibacter michiganensis]PPF65864.1 TetR/AcrR family transcriptional regulator [Clavibacter michiganensis]